MSLFKRSNEWRKFTITNESYVYDDRYPLLSINLASNRPDQITEFIENIHSSCSNKNAYEIIVKIDAEDTATINCVAGLSEKYGLQRIRPLIGPKKLGPWSLWEFYNETYRMAHEKVYFMWLPSDEVRIVTKDWDLILKKYIGFYQDNIFRLKLSDNRLRNFYRLEEVLSSPDNFPFITKKWMDICGGWGDCHSPDTFQQAVSYELGRVHIFRDIPIFEIELTGIEAGLLIPPDKLKSRAQNIRKLWHRALTNPMRSRYRAHAMKLKFFIQSCEEGAKNISFSDRARYPSRVIASNDLGTKAVYKCEVYGFNIYGLKLIAHYFKVNLISAIQAIMINPVAVAIMLISAAGLLMTDVSLTMRLVCLGSFFVATRMYKMGHLKPIIYKVISIWLNPGQLK
jgi:hypothetical protein